MSFFVSSGCVKKECPVANVAPNRAPVDASMCGEGTVFEHGECRARMAAEGDASMCGEGTIFKDGKCLSHEAAYPPSPVVQEFAAISDKMCACADKACAEAVNNEFEVWLTRNEKTTGSKADQDRAREIAETYTKCMMSAMAGVSGSTGAPESSP